MGELDSKLAELPQPGRRGGDEASVPFDPMGYQVLRALEEVKQTNEPALGVVTQGQINDARRKARFVPKFTALESMYANHPEIVASGKLRIERIQPQWHQHEFQGQMKVSGVLSFDHPIISSQEFAAKFGGFKYRVYGIVEQENKENRGGPPQPTEIAVTEFELPVPPNIQNLPLLDPAMYEEGNPEMFSPYGRQRPMNMGYPQSPAVDPLGPVLSLAERALSRNDGMPNAAWEVLGKQSENTVQSMREQSAQQTNFLAGQVDRLERQLEREREEARERSNKPTDIVQMVDGMSRLVAAQKGSADSDVISSLRQDHERVVRNLMDEHERSMMRLREDSDRQLSRLQNESERTLSREREHHQLKVQAIETRIKDLEAMLREREREGRDEAERRESRAREEMQRILDLREREYQRRVEETNSAHVRELQSLKEMHDREIRMNESVVNNTRTTVDQSHAMEVRSIQTELAKMQAELEEKRRIVIEYEREKNKPLLDQVKDHKETMEALNEIAGTKTDDDGDEPEESKWYNSPMAREIAAALVTKGAEVLPAVMEKVSSKEKPVQAPVHHIATSPNPPRRPNLPPRRRQAMTFADVNDAPVRAYQDIPYSQPSGIGEKVTGPTQFDVERPQEDWSSVQPSVTRVERPAQPAYSPPQPVQQMAAQPPAQPPVQPVEPTARAVAPVGTDDWSAFSWLPMPQEALQQFIGQLDSALANDITPAQLAESFTTNYSKKDIKQILQVIDAKKLVESLRACPHTKDMQISSGKGKRFLTRVWALLEEATASDGDGKEGEEVATEQKDVP